MTTSTRITILMNNEPGGKSSNSGRESSRLHDDDHSESPGKGNHVTGVAPRHMPHVKVHGKRHGKALQCEHGLSLWIEHGGRRILFDTGQSPLLIRNAELLGINLAETDAVVLSHGHYDHTGGLTEVLKHAPEAEIYLHPAAVEDKYSRNGRAVRYNGMATSTKESLRRRRIQWTRTPTEIFDGVYVTGEIPRNNDIEDTGGDFCTDASCRTPDPLPDDQALFIETESHRFVILGCGHSGVVNTLEHIERLAGSKSPDMVIGGMHLLHADAHRIDFTIDELRRRKTRLIVPLHCTGVKAVERLKEAFGDTCQLAGTGEYLLLP
ncbi:MAG: MBL fold metallo-hydrolase [Bacteroidota bacterium]